MGALPAWWCAVKQLGFVLLAPLLLSACVSAPPQPPLAESVSPPAAFKHADPEPAAAHGLGADWWTAFGDPALDAWMRTALQHNTQIHLAAARLRQAQARLQAAAALRAPQWQAQLGLSQQQGPVGTGDDGGWLRATTAVSYEPDLLGRLSGAQEAATRDADAQADLQRGVQLLVQARVAQAALALRAVDAEAALLRQVRALDRQALDIQAQRWRHGSIAEAELLGPQDALARSELELSLLARRRAELENALALLLGQAASDFAAPVSAAAPMLTQLPTVPPQLPAAMLARRPNVAAAQHSTLAAQARLRVAASADMPQFAFNASAGLAAGQLGAALSSALRLWSLGGVASLPLWDGGRRDAQRAQAAAALDEASLGLREQTLVAVREVEDQLAALRQLRAQAEQGDLALARGARLSAQAQARQQRGTLSTLELLAVQRQQHVRQRDALQLQAARAQTTVALVQALGGGWE